MCRSMLQVPLIQPMFTWYVYLIRCCDNSLYPGVTTDPIRKLQELNSGRGSMYAWRKRPVHLAWSERMRDRSAAMRRKAAIRRLPTHQKEQLVLRGADPAMVRAVMLGESWSDPSGRRSDVGSLDELCPAERDRW